MKTLRRIKSNRHGYVYLITFTRPTDLKEFYYVGQRLGKVVDLNYTGSGSRIRYLKRKYGTVGTIEKRLLHWCFSQSELNIKETKQIRLARDLYGKQCLNLMHGGANGERHESTKAKISASKMGNTGRKGIPLSDEHKAKLSAYRTGRPLSKEHAEAISRGLKGKPQSAGTVAAHLGAKRSDETKAKMRAAHLGKKHSPETIAKMRESAKRVLG